MRPYRIGICTRCVQHRFPSPTTYRPGSRYFLHSYSRSLNQKNISSQRSIWNHKLNHACVIIPRSTSLSSLPPFAAGRSMSTIRSFATAPSPQQSNGNGEGPIQEYDRRVKADLLRDDAHQRSMLYPSISQ